MTTWGDLREQVKRSLLADNADRWTNEQLLDYLNWSLDGLCEHTAAASATEFEGDGTTKTFNLPSNVFGNIVENGYVYTVANERPAYLNPVKLYTGAPKSFYTRPDTILHVETAPADGDTLYVLHYCYYTHPISDDAVLDSPPWADRALAYRMATHCYSPKSTRAANLGQFKRGTEKGTPEDNPWREEQKWFMEMYRQELEAHEQQIRTNHTRPDAKR